jgi:hypothetical protein
MKPTALLTLIASLFLIPTLSFASLGGNTSSIQADQQALRAQQGRIAAHPHYSIHEITEQDTHIQEYVSDDNRVFAITWKGSVQPDLSTLLGSYYPDFQKAVRQSRHQRKGRAPMILRSPRLNVELGGHMRALHGRAWIPELLPEGFNTDEIR